MIQFNIDQWHAWAPGIQTPEDWASWYQAPWLPDNSMSDTPDVSFLPAMQRRRLSPLARMVFAVAWPLAEQQPPMPVVFVSRHSETPRNYELLCELAREQELSPTQFSLSVHNAIIGLWSILRGDRSEMTALAGEADGLEHGLLEACALLDEGAEQVLVIAAEGLQPEPYQPWIKDAAFPYAVALRLTRGSNLSLSLSSATTNAEPSYPHALELIRQLLSRNTSWQSSCSNRLWQWKQSA